MSKPSHRVYEGSSLIPAWQYLNRYEKPDGAYLYRFLEDIRLAFMPIGGKSRRENFSISITGSDSELAIGILSSLTRSQHKNDVYRLVCDAFETILLGLLWESSAIFEIVCLDKKISLFRISPRGLFFIPGMALQMVPRGAVGSGFYGLKCCPSRKLLRFSIPAALGSSHGYRSMISKLKRVDPGSNSRLDFELHSDAAINFDYAKYNFFQHAAMNKIVSARGWGDVGGQGELTTEYFQLDAKINRSYVQANLRASIESNLNKFFKRLSLDALIVISGLPSTSEIKATSAALRDGHISFAEAHRRVST